MIGRINLRQLSLSVLSLLALGLFIGLYLTHKSLPELIVVYSLAILAAVLSGAILVLLVHTMVYNENWIFKIVSVVLSAFVMIFLIESTVQFKVLL